MGYKTFKGTPSEYRMLHYWIAEQMGKANTCVECNGTSGSPRFDWSNISGEYRKDLDDWRQLCRKCHARVDNYGFRRLIPNQCKYGHELTGDNTYTYPDGNKSKECKICRKRQHRIYGARRLARKYGLPPHKVNKETNHE